MVRPLLAPMAEAAAEAQTPGLSAEGASTLRAFVRAHAAAVDTIGVFFGEDIFIAMSSILLIKSFLDTSGISIQPLGLSLWAIPTALAAFVIHGVRVLLLDQRIARWGSPSPRADPGEAETGVARGGA